VLPGEEQLEWRLVIDTADEDGFVDDGEKYASGDDFEVEGRAAKLLRLTAGSQAKARHESWKKRQYATPQAAALAPAGSKTAVRRRRKAAASGSEAPA
jgi:hypothetical protein